MFERKVCTRERTLSGLIRTRVHPFRARVHLSCANNAIQNLKKPSSCPCTADSGKQSHAACMPIQAFLHGKGDVA